MQTYAECSRPEIDKAAREINLTTFAIQIANPPGGDKAGFCERYLDRIKRNPSSFCQ